MPLDDSNTVACIHPLTTWGTLPRSARVLFVTTSSASADWLRELFAADNVMSVTVEESIGAAQGLARLREEALDAVIVQHVPEELDALAFAEGHRASGADDALLIIGTEPEAAFAPLCYEVGADAYALLGSASPRQIIWLVARAMEWHRLVRENHRLAQYERERLRLEHSEAERLLSQQRGLISGLEEIRNASTTATTSTGEPDSPMQVPSSLVDHYLGLLRAHVIMGSGNLASETAAMVDTIFSLSMPAPRVMQLHLHALETTLRGLGSRSSRHVMARADLLVLEVMTQLAERYRQGAKPAVPNVGGP
jgi:DNA-binding NarL/FixJ family response regulator